MSVTTYDVDEQGVALLRLDRPEVRNAIDTAMLEEMLGHLDAARRDEGVRVLVLSSTDHLGLSAGADVREQLDEDGRVRRMELFARLYDELTGFPSRRSPPATARAWAAGPRSPSPATCGWPGPTSACASRAPRSASRWAPPGWSRSAVSRWRSTCC